MAEIKARLAAKPENAQVEGSIDAKTEMETRLTDTPTNVQVESFRDDKVEIETGGDGAEIMLSK